jgi:hypothetical protein
LKCMQRRKGESVPGCSMDSRAKPGGAWQGIDFCYKPGSARFTAEESALYSTPEPDEPTGQPEIVTVISAVARSTSSATCGLAAVLFVLLA